MTAILGVSAFYHDSAAALVVDGEIVAAAQEERFTRRKHDASFPQQALDYCLAEAGLEPKQVDLVAFYDKPLLKFDRLLETYLSEAPRGLASFLHAMPVWLREKLHLGRALRRGMRGAYDKRFVYTLHHESHAASAFYPSPFDEAAILTLDGVGEWSTASMGEGRGREIKLLSELRFPHSLGLLYSAFTYFCGFRVNSGEYKLMGLAPYGEPRFAGIILERLVHLRDDGSFWMDMEFFDHARGLRMTNRKFDALFGGPPRAPESELTQREMDLAASVQVVTEEIMVRCARHARERTGLRNLVLAGGVALNCVGNGRILREKIFDGLWIQPAAGDAGGALGAALFTWHQLLGKPRTVGKGDAQKGSLLGPAIDAEQAGAALKARGAVIERIDDEAALCERVASEIAAGKVVGWVQGRMEFGPRALGARSILGDPRSRDMQVTMNVKIKFRESFRPFAPSVLAERCPDWFEMEAGQESPYMLLVAPVHPARRLEPAPKDRALVGIDRLKSSRSVVPAITHVDGSARVQTVDEARNPLYHRLLRAFEDLTGCPLLVNTSFNVRGEPIVNTAEDAYRCFLATDMDVLVVGPHLMLKHAQPVQMTGAERERHLAAHGLD